MSRTESERGKIFGRKHGARIEFYENPIFKENKSARGPWGKKNAAGCPEYRRPKIIAPAHAAAQTWVGVGFEPTEKNFLNVFEKK